jgi:hypothetical protein
MATQPLQAVLTGDLQNSSTLMAQAGSDSPARVLKAAFEQLRKGLGHGAILGQPAIFRGDSFQLLLADAGASLRWSLLLACRVKASAADLFDFNMPLPRLGLGIGSVSYRPKRGPITAGQGEAFERSGLALDETKATQCLLQIRTPWQEPDRELAIQCRLIDHLLKGLSVEQCLAIAGILEGHTQNEIASHLGITQPAVHSRLAAANYKALLLVADRLTEIVHRQDRPACSS